MKRELSLQEMKHNESRPGSVRPQTVMPARGLSIDRCCLLHYLTIDHLQREDRFRFLPKQHNGYRNFKRSVAKRCFILTQIVSVCLKRAQTEICSMLCLLCLNLPSLHFYLLLNPLSSLVKNKSGSLCLYGVLRTLWWCDWYYTVLYCTVLQTSRSHDQITALLFSMECFILEERLLSNHLTDIWEVVPRPHGTGKTSNKTNQNIYSFIYVLSCERHL